MRERQGEMHEYREASLPRERGDLFEHNDAGDRVPATGWARGAAAIAVSISVMLAGGGFLALVTQTPALRGAPPAAEAAPSASPVLASAAAAADAPVLPAAPSPVAMQVAGVAEVLPIDTRGRAPRIGPRRAGAAAATPSATPLARPITLGGAMLIDAEDGPPPFFTLAELEPLRVAPQSLWAVYGGDVSEGPATVRVAIAKGETFVDALRRAGVRAEDRNAAASAFGAHQNLRALLPGQEFVLTTAEPNQTLFQLASATAPSESHLLALDFRADAENRISLKRAADGGFEARKSAAPLTSRLVAVSGRIDGSLYLSAKRVGAPDDVIAGLADMFAYDVDFQREIFGGDEFEAIFEVRYDEKGEMAATGDILYGRLKWRGRTKEKGYYLFADYDGRKRGDYFDRAGQSAKRLLMKTPIDGARLSSGFGTRKHPILGYQRAHKGVDFAANSGTPIKAAGDGVIERAGPYGSFGNYVKIRHANGYKTAYAHMRAIRKGIRTGARVEQGDIIGYVGTTGRSTGPHLHYEVHYKDQQVNPQNLKIATGVELKGRELEAFKTVRDRIDAMRAPEAPPSDLIADKSGATSAL